jgi:glycosyltransferase involved in cell wall biosynthesis
LDGLKIAIVRTTLHRGSGQAVHIKEIGRRLVRRGHEVTIFAREVFEDLDSLPSRRVSSSFDGVPFIRHLGFTMKAGVLIQGYDLVHTQYHPDIFVGNYLHSIKNIPHVFTYHGFAPIRLWVNPMQKLKMIDHKVGTFPSLRAGVDQIISVSEFLKNELTSRFMIRPEKIQVIYNGVDPERFRPEVNGEEMRKRYGLAHRPVVLFLGRLAPYKGIQYLIKAIPSILKQIPEAIFLIAGSARYDTARIGSMLATASMRRAVIFTGFVPESEVPKIYAACDLFCYPSLWEGFGLTPAEAQACGKPVVAFRHCALPEVVAHGETGILVKPGDHEELANAVVELLSDPARMVEMGRRGHRRVKRLFSWDVAADRTVSVYERAISIHGMQC